MWRVFCTLAFFVVLSTGVVLYGCSSGGGGANSSNNTQKSESATSSASAQASKETASSESASSKTESGKATSGKAGSDKAKTRKAGVGKAGPDKVVSKKKNKPSKERGGGKLGASGGNGMVPALSGTQSADRVARKWHEDAKLYSIASLSPDVDAQGRASGWLYSYVSVSSKAVVLIAVEGGKARISQEPPVPESQITLIAADALPSPGGLIGSTEAMRKTKKVKNAIQKDPGGRASAGLDSFSSGQPVWILSTIDEGGKRLEERVTATS